MFKKVAYIFSLIMGLIMLILIPVITVFGEDTDSTPPTLYVNPTSGNLTPGTKIVIAAKDTSGIHHIGYCWDNDKSTTPVYQDSTTVTVPEKVGTHILYVYAKDNSPNNNTTGWKSYNFSVIVFENTDNTPPNLDVNPSSGKIKPGTKILITAKDNTSGIHHIGYCWDNDKSTTPVYQNPATVTVPEKAGTHILYVYAKDNSTNYNTTGWKSYNFSVIGENSTIFIDDVPPEITVNPMRGDVFPGETITISANDPSGINQIGYGWKTISSAAPINENTATITVPDNLPNNLNKANINWRNDDKVTITVPNNSPENQELYVFARDNSQNHNMSQWVACNYTVKNLSDIIILKWIPVLAIIIAIVGCIIAIVGLKTKVIVVQHNPADTNNN